MRCLLNLLWLSSIALANVEKVIFLGPESLPLEAHRSSINNLNLEILTPQSSTLRTKLLPQFPSKDATDGSQAWLFVHGLTAGTRYEIRICWAATVSGYSSSRILCIDCRTAADSIQA